MQLSTPPIIKHLLHCFISKYKNVDRFPVCEWEDREYKKRKQKREGKKRRYATDYWQRLRLPTKCLNWLIITNRQIALVFNNTEV